MDVANGLLILLLIAPAVYATEFTVGDTDGWNQDVDYTSWVSGKNFSVGDTLLFQYGPTHSVDIVSSSDYQNCASTTPLLSYSSGNDRVTINSTGTMYFICPTTYHCFQGMRLEVNVGGSSSATPITPSSSPTTSNSPSSAIRVAGNLCNNVNALVLGLGLGISLVYYAIMG
ncbi:stellacyanin-like [Macadamia integrifolia]|uniref:stellacyanin-like n=1 Tax=Macadamia integrifolia TaxID=60698 RepID=UPI001C4EC8B7|nr:stellacyanin-like [Macadamia integrifolia]